MRVDWPVVGRGDELTAIGAGLRRGVGTLVVGEAGVGKTMLLRELKRLLDAEGWATSLALATAVAQSPLQGVDELPAAGGGRAVLLVDDTQLLDADSAKVVWRLAATGGTLVVATARSGEPLPPDVDRLWTAGACERLDLKPFAEGDVRTLLEAVLGGDVEDRIVRMLFTRAGGNALLLRELVRSGVDSGALVRRHEVWTLDGELPLGSGVRELIRRALAGLADDELRAAQLLAVGEPLALAVVAAIVEPDLLEALEQQRIVVLQDAVDGPAVTLGHPLYGEVLRSEIPPLRLRRLRLELAQAIADVPASAPRDGVRSALWRLEAGAPPDAAALLAAARLARSFNPAAAERLAEAALDAGAPAEGRILLASLMTMQGRLADAGRWLDGLAPDLLSDGQRREVAGIRAFVQTQDGRLSEASAMIGRLAAESAENSAQLQAIHAQGLVFDGRLDEGLARAAALFDDDGGDAAARTIAAMALTAGSHFIGDVDNAVRMLGRARGIAEAARDRVPYGPGTIAVAGTLAMAFAGRLAEADRLAREVYDRGLAEDDPWTRPRGASGLGIIALVRGRVRTAARYLRITAASLNDFDRLFLRYNLALMVRGVALCGAVEEAERALRSGADALAFRIFEDDWDLARACVHAARGEFPEAVDLALRTAEGAAGIGSWAISAMAAHDALRYGAGSAAGLAGAGGTGKEAAGLLLRAATRIDAPMYRLMAAHAQAGKDAAALDKVSAGFEELGALLLATETAYAAGSAHRADGDGRSAAASLARGIALHARCEGAQIPWSTPNSGGLTPREHQIAVLAAAGRSDAQIAAELGVSGRTVSTHLSNVYAKLDVGGRRQLPEAL